MGGGPPAKLEILEGGEAEYYDSVSDTTPLVTVEFAIVDDWTDSGEHWFECLSDAGGTPMYTLMVLSDGGDAMASNSDPTDYPTAIDPDGSYYGKFTRQE
jgi:hypothetical protein